MPHHRQKGFRSDPNGFPGDQALVARFEEFAGSGETCSHSPQGVAFFVMIFPALYRHDLWQGKQDIPPWCKEKLRICLRFHMLSITKALNIFIYIYIYIHSDHQGPKSHTEEKTPRILLQMILLGGDLQSCCRANRCASIEQKRHLPLVVRLRKCSHGVFSLKSRAKAVSDKEKTCSSHLGPSPLLGKLPLCAHDFLASRVAEAVWKAGNILSE